ncbi:hypothetical protein PE067_16215 [Paracoccus sp. DMF-8]|uniref:hypothetical protein n=1 Tax=Paracoccus sp. DMF-8 TaxID=3019445 RepID=UPI0023E389F6|nr:hypothetical protein [Paracoccus sp. DMF-8]MDF3607553.1 hypothetical protein [Paracoccus sp. DMF-8]
MSSKQSSSVKIPQYIQDASQDAIRRAQEQASIGYMPYYGIDVAGFTPQQEAAFQGVNDMASAFGMQGAQVQMPQAMTQNGITGYSSGSLYDQALAELQRRNPGQYDAYSGLFINPQTGAAPTSAVVNPRPTQPTQPTAPGSPTPAYDRESLARNFFGRGSNR